MTVTRETYRILKFIVGCNSYRPGQFAAFHLTARDATGAVTIDVSHRPAARDA